MNTVHLFKLRRFLIFAGLGLLSSCAPQNKKTELPPLPGQAVKTSNAAVETKAGKFILLTVLDGAGENKTFAAGDNGLTFRIFRKSDLAEVSENATVTVQTYVNSETAKIRTLHLDRTNSIYKTSIKFRKGKSASTHVVRLIIKDAELEDVHEMRIDLE